MLLDYHLQRPSTNLFQHSTPINVYGGSRDGAEFFTRLFLWTPQLLWALAAAGLLLGLAIGLRRQQHLWWLQPLPYLMVLGAIGLQMALFGVIPFLPNVPHQAIDEAMLWETATPSIWALPGLAALHTVVVSVQWWRRLKWKWKNSL